VPTLTDCTQIKFGTSLTHGSGSCSYRGFVAFLTNLRSFDGEHLDKSLLTGPRYHPAVKLN
jgi:hypothetical protein